MQHPLRARFANDIVAEFLPPPRIARLGARGHIGRNRTDKNRIRRAARGDKIIIFLDGLPAMPAKRALMDYFAKKGYWAFHPRYRGTWESGGAFLARAPHEDVRDVISGVMSGAVADIGTEQRYCIRPERILVLGGSFGGAAAILSLRDSRVTAAIAIAPVTDWREMEKTEPAEIHGRYVARAFGAAYRAAPGGWKKLKSGTFYNPAAVAGAIDGSKLFIAHAKDDDVVAWRPVAKFAKRTGATLVILPRGGHLSSSVIMKPRIAKRLGAFLRQVRSTARRGGNLASPTRK